MSNSQRRPASGVVGVSRRRARPNEPGAALATSASLQRPSTLTSYGRAIGCAGVVRSAASSSRYSPSSPLSLAGFEVREAGELREVDHRRVRQPADHLAREVALDLLGPELVHELLQQLARLGAARRAHADRRQQEAIALGDDDMQAHMAGDEVLELVAHGADQRRVDAEVGAGTKRIGAGASFGAAARSGVDVEVGLVQVARVARRQVAAAGDAADALDAMENPRFHGHGWPSMDQER